MKIHEGKASKWLLKQWVINNQRSSEEKYKYAPDWLAQPYDHGVVESSCHTL